MFSMWLKLFVTGVMVCVTSEGVDVIVSLLLMFEGKDVEAESTQ